MLWIDYLKEKNCDTLFRIHDNGPFLVSWVANWQKEVSKSDKIIALALIILSFNSILKKQKNGVSTQLTKLLNLFKSWIKIRIYLQLLLEVL